MLFSTDWLTKLQYPRLQPAVGQDSSSGGIKTEQRPVMGDVVFRLKPFQRLILRHPAFKHRAHQLSRPHSRQGSPDRLLPSGAEHCTVDGKLHDLLTQTVCMDPAGQARVLHSRTTVKTAFAVTIQAAGRSHPSAFMEADFHPSPFRLSVRIFRPLTREQGHQHLFRGVLILMSVKIEFHAFDYTRAFPE